MIVKVVISKATLVPWESLDLSSLGRLPTTYLGPLEALTTTDVDGTLRLDRKRKGNNYVFCFFKIKK